MAQKAMRRRSRAGPERAKSRTRKTAAPKRRNEPKPKQRRPATREKGSTKARRLERALRESEERYALGQQRSCRGNLRLEHRARFTFCLRSSDGDFQLRGTWAHVAGLESAHSSGRHGSLPHGGARLLQA